MIYFDNSATSRYTPKCMIDSMCEALSSSSNPGRSAHSDAIELSSRIYSVRSSIKRYLNASDDYEVIFTKNTTEALNMAILGYVSRFRYKIHIITSMLEHNSVLRPLKYLASLGKADVTILPIKNGTIDIEDIEMNIMNNTRLIVLCHTSNVIGTTIDLKSATDVANAYNIPILIDTAQSLGHTHINLDVTPITLVACAGHKGLHGPIGTGFLLVNRHSVTLEPLTYGGTGTNSNILMMDTEYPESFEVGTINAPAILGLGASIDWTHDNFDTVNSHIIHISKVIYDYLSTKDNVTLYSPNVCPVLSFNIGDYSSEEVASYLNDRDIAVRSGLHCAPLVHSNYGTLERGMVRVSVGYNNSLIDADALISALDTIPT